MVQPNQTIMNTDNRLYRFVKASERLPDVEQEYFVRWITTGNTQKMSKRGIESYKSNIEWLEPIAETSQEEQQDIIEDILTTHHDWHERINDKRTYEEVVSELSSKYILIKR